MLNLKLDLSDAENISVQREYKEKYGLFLRKKIHSNQLNE